MNFLTQLRIGQRLFVSFGLLIVLRILLFKRSIFHFLAAEEPGARVEISEVPGATTSGFCVPNWVPREENALTVSSARSEVACSSMLPTVMSVGQAIFASPARASIVRISPVEK